MYKVWGAPSTIHKYHLSIKNQSIMKKKVHHFKQMLLIATFTIISTTLQAQVSLTATGGSSTGFYSSLKGAFDNINAGIHSGSITITLTSGTVETATAVLDSSGNGFSSYTSITIASSVGNNFPVTGIIAGDLVRFNGADFVNVSNVTFDNSSTTGTSTIRLTNDASNNNFSSCIFRGASATTSAGTFVFATGITTGNDNNSIVNCILDSSSGGYPTNAILSTGTVGFENSNNTISGCKIANFYNATLATTGINISTGSNGWSIVNNRLYQSFPRTYTSANNHRGIAVTVGTGYSINNNTIGFADSTTTGYYTMNGAVATTFAGITLTAGTTGSNTISGNIIANIDLTTTSTTATVNGVFAGITVTTGNAVILNNTIGSTTGLASIKVVPGSAGALMGINSSSVNTITIQGNSLGALQNIGAAAATIASIHCINISGAATALTIRNNTIGNPDSNNVVAGVLGTTTANTLVSGINQPSTSLTIVAVGNTIRNLSSFGSGSGGYVRGYHTSLSTSATSTARVDSNIVFNLQANSSATGIGSAVGAVNGIHYLANLAGGTISNNTVYNLRGLNTGTGNYYVTGVSIGSATNTTISNNRIYNLRNEGTSTAATTPAIIAGIVLRSATTTVKVINNFISLGNGVTNNVAIIGIHGNHGSSPNPIDSILFNTVHIEGTVSSGAQPSFGFYRGDFTTTARTITVAIYGNIFHNTRTGGTGKHYAISNGFGVAAPSSTGWGAGASNYNILTSASASTIGSWGNVDYTLPAWVTISGNDANSLSKTVSFANTATGDLHLGVASQTDPDLAVPFLSVVPSDYDGQARITSMTQAGGDQHLTPCTAPPTAGTAVSSVSSICANTPFTLNMSGVSSGTGITSQWQISTTGTSGSFTNILNATNSSLTTTQTATRFYRYYVTCSAQTDTSAAVQIITITTPFSGVITVDTSLTLSGTNYHSLRQLASDLTCRGVSGSVTVNVAGYHTEKSDVDFGTIPGVSSLNPLVINGNGSTIQTGASPAVFFHSSKFIVLDSFNIIQTSNGIGIHITNQSQYLTIRKSKIDVGTTSTATTNCAIAIAAAGTNPIAVGDNGQYITIEDNRFIGGYYGVTAIGNTGYVSNTNNIIRRNSVEDFYIYGIYMLHGDSNRIENNNINRATRGTITTLYGIYFGQSRNTRIANNRIHSTGSASYTAYPIYIVNCLNTAGFETVISNNLIYNVQTSGVFYGMYALTTNFSGFRIYHNTIRHDVPTSSTSAIRGLFAAVAPANVEFRNNIISITGGGTGVKTGIYLTTTSTTFTSNNNVLYVASSASNNIGFWGAANLTLSDWQTASGQDAASVSLNPVFTTALDQTPLSINIDNIGTPVGIVTDINGVSRSTTTPDVGAIEFTGISGDIKIMSSELKRASSCYSANDTLNITIQNLIGATVDFSIDPLTVVWRLLGPVNTLDSFIISTGTLAVGNNLTIQSTNANRSLPGNYILNAYIKANGVNTSVANDTLAPLNSEIKPILSSTRTPSTGIASSPTDTVVLTANSPLFPNSGIKFTEIAHFKTTVGQPTAGWPSYLIADDYVELSGVPNSDLAGFTYEEWTATALQFSVTFPPGTLFSPTGTLILATGQLGASTPVPSSFYYHTGGTATKGSTGSLGYVIRNSTGTIVDAVVYGTLTFPALSGVTASDWTGTTTAANSGIRLTAADNNTSSGWVNSSTAPQDPNTFNSGVPTILPGTLTGFTWYHLGAAIGTSPRITVGPYTVPGTYVYVAQYINTCGTFYDTVTVTATSTVPVKLTAFIGRTDNNQHSVLFWQTASESNNSHFDVQRSADGITFETIKTVKGRGTTQSLSSYSITDENSSSVAPTLYYRLKQVDFDGSEELSAIVTVNFKQENNHDMRIFPNPFAQEAHVDVVAPTSGNLTIEVMDAQGRILHKQVSPLKPGNNKLAIDNSEQLDNGLYFIKTTFDNYTKVSTVIKN